MFVVDIHLKVGVCSQAAAAPAAVNHAELFISAYTGIQNYLLSTMSAAHKVDPARLRYLKTMMDTTCLGGKYNRGITVVEVVDELTKRQDAAVRKDALFSACVCGWIIEMLQAHFLVEDDIMDGSITRRGKPCWYRHPGVTTGVAINDGLIVLAWCSQLAFHYFADKPFLMAVLQLLHTTDYQTTIGQFFDNTSMVDPEKLDPHVKQPTATDYHEFTFEHYQRIVLFKTSYYTYNAPLAFGALIARDLPGFRPVDLKLVERVALVMGEYFQVQDDVLDCFADPIVLGKIGTDIQDSKCSWLAVTFLQVASEKQIADFKANYGSHDEKAIATVKALYTEVKLQDRFAEYEARTVTVVEQGLAELAAANRDLAHAARLLWNKTYKRTK
jgi:farnesyl diphosphate synthase